MAKNNNRKVGIIGMGHVGSHAMNAVANLGIANELVLYDIDEAKATSECWDIFDTMSMLPHDLYVHTSDIEGLSDCDVIIHAAGKISLLYGSTDRSLELKYTVPAVHTWAEPLKKTGFDGCVINISNPCDVVTREIAMILDLPEGRVFGTGTGLDTARLLARLRDRTGVDSHSIVAYMMGEHGNAQFAPWSIVNFRGMPLDEMAKQNDAFAFDRDKMEHSARMGGWDVFSGKKCTEYAIGLIAARMAGFVLNDEKAVQTASCHLTGQYGQEDIYVGAPAIIGAGGVEHIMELPLTSTELQRFDECCKSIRENMALADEFMRGEGAAETKGE